MSTPRYADLTWDQIKETPAWEGLSIEGRVGLANEYHADIAAYLQESGEATDEKLAKVNEVRRSRIFEISPSLKQPEDIGVAENVSNAFTKSMSSFKENIYFNLLEQNPEEAARYRTNLEREYPTREGFSEKVGRITGMMLPTGVALLSAPITGPLGLTGAAAIATGAIYGASSAGAALGDIHAYEQATGEDVSSGKTAAVMAGHAAFEMITETFFFSKLLGIARRTGAAIGTDAAEAAGRAILSGSKRETALKMTDAVSDFFTHNKAARLGLGWVQMGAVEGVEELASQIGQSATDILLYRPYENSRDGFAAMMNTAAEGALGGLLMGPLAIGVQAQQGARVREAMYQQSKVLLNDTLMAEARRRGGGDDELTNLIYEDRASQLEADPIYRPAFENPDFMLLKENQGMAGVELLPVLGNEKAEWKAVRYVAKDGTPVVLLNMSAVKDNAALSEFAATHDFFHGIETVLGPEGTLDTARELAASIPEFSKYRAELDAAYIRAKIAPQAPEYAVSEIMADIFGQVFFKPQFQQAAIKAAAANPAIARSVVTKLKDMRGRFERMGRRVDAYMALTPEQQDAAGGVAQLPVVAMQAAKAKIDATTTYLDALTRRFVKGFETAVALKEKTEAQAKVQGDEGEGIEDLVTGGVAPLSVNEYHGTSTPIAALSDYYGSERSIYGTGFYTTDSESTATGYTRKGRGGSPTLYRVTQKREPRLFDLDAPLPQEVRDVAAGDDLLAEALDSNPKTTRELFDAARALSREDTGISASDTQDSFDLVSAALEQSGFDGYTHVGGKNTGNAPHKVRIYWKPDSVVSISPQLSVIESLTPQEIFSRAYSEKSNQFLKTPEGEALRAVWNNSRRTSYVLTKMFLGKTRYIAPGRLNYLSAQAELANARAGDAAMTGLSPRERLAWERFQKLPDWVKANRQDVANITRKGNADALADQEEETARIVVQEWSSDAFRNKSLLGTDGIDPAETALGFIQENDLAPDGGWDLVVAGRGAAAEEVQGRKSEGRVSTDQVMEVLASYVEGFNTKDSFRQQVAKMAQEELKPHLDDLARRKVNKEIERLRITRQTAYDLPAATVQRVADMDFKNPLMQRLVSRDDLRQGDVVLQKGTLYWVRGFDPDGTPEMVYLQGQEKPFDATPAALDDPNQDPEIAKDYRFGMEALPVTPYYGVEIFFNPNWSENQDILALVDDAQIAVEKPLMPWEREAPMSVNEQGFYSKLEQVIQAKMPNAASPQQVMATIDPGKGSGVKAEEIKWSGIAQALDALAVDGKVPKDALLKYLADEGAVRFEEVTLAERRKPTQAEEDRYAMLSNFPEDALDSGQREELARLEEIVMATHWETPNEAPTAFSTYTLPGGTRYREVVLTMPEDLNDWSEWVVKKDRHQAGGKDVWEAYRRGGGSDSVFVELPAGSSEAEAKSALARKRAAGKGPPAYASPHFPDIPNYVAHMRLNEREGGLFIEEIQSDRHQRGRTQGYYSARDRAEAQAYYNKLVDDGIPMLEARRQTDERFEQGEVPDAPFRKDWPLQMFKRALRDAVAAGKKWIGWTTGETQADRFDLSKKVAAINYWDTGDGDGSFGMHVEALGGGPRIFEDDAVSAQRVADTVGKDVLARMQAGEGEDIGNGVKSLTGDDLKVGGEGMKGFYDDILPKEIGKYVKQWGAKVEKGSLGGQDAGGGYEIGPEGVVKTGETSTPIWKVEITPEMSKSVAAGQPQFSINEELTQMKGTSAAMRNVWKQKQSYEEMAGRAKALLAGTADTYQAKLQKISLTPGDGLTGGAVRVFALRQLADEGIERALSKPMDYLRTYFGIDSRWTDEQAKRLMQAKLSDLELAMLSELSASGTTLGAAAYSSEGLPYSSHKNRFIGWFKTMMDMFGVSTAAKRDISGARAQEIRNGIHFEVKDTLAEMMDQFRNMPEGEYKPAIRAFVAERAKDRFRAKLEAKRKKPAAPMSVSEEAAGGELIDRIFADFGTFYRRLKSPVGESLRQEIAEAYGADMVDDLVAEMETYAEVFPDETEAAKALDPTPAPVKVLVDDLAKNVGTKAQRALQAELAAIYKGEANDILREEYEQTIAPASLKRAAKAAVMTEEEQAKAIDTAMNDLAKAVFKRLKNRQGGAQLVKDGMLTEAGVLRDLQPLRERMMEAEMPMNVLKGAVNEIMREAGVTISDMLKLNSETFGQVSAGIAADVAGALKAKLAATPALEAFPDVVEAAAAKAGTAVERMLRKRLEDRIETMENTAMVDWNFIQRQGRAFVAPFVDVVMQGAKPFRDTAKGAASIILGDQAAWKARVGESLRAASAKAVMLNPAADILLPFRTGLGLPETATMEDVEAALLAVKLPPTIARRVAVEHLAQTERSLADMATSLEPERVQAQVVQELVAEFGPDSADVWVPAVRDLVAERTAIIKKRLVQPKTRKAGQRQDVLDRLLFAAASGSFDDAALMDFIAEQAGMPPLSPETKAKLQVLVQKELDAIIETKDPGSVNVKPFTMEISILLAREVMQSWPKGTFTKASVLRIINAFFASALSGFKTWMVTNPLGSELKLLFTMSEMTLRNALLDPTLKKAGFRGTLSAWSHMLKSFSLAPVKAALFDAVVPGRINRKLSLGGSYVDAGLFDVSQDLGWLSKTHPDVAKNIGAVTNWVYGNLAKYVPRLIWSGDVTQYHRGNEFGSFEKARKEVMEEHPDWSHNQVIDAVYDRLGVTPFGKPKEKFIEAARIESEKLFGPGQPEYRILNRAFEMARAARGDTLFAAGDFAGAQSTFTGTIGVGYAEIEGAYVPQGKDTAVLEKLARGFSEAKQSDNPFISLGATALAPFTNIASVIMDATFTYTLFPGIIRYREMVGLAANEENERLRKNYEEGAQLQLVRMVNGTLVTAAMILLAAASRDEEDPWFKITGAGPKDFRKNWQWREAGNRPFSLTIFGKNGVQIDFRTHPLYAFLAAVGTWSDQMNEDPDDRAGLVSAWSSGFLSSLQNQSFMSSIADLMGAISGRDEAAGQQKLMSLFINPALTAAVPASGALRQIEETFFPYPNASRIEDNFFLTFVRTALARLPVANGILPRKVNALGRDIENDRPLETTVGLAGWKRGSDDDAAKVFDWAVRKQAWIPTPSVFQTRLAPPEDAMTVGERRQIAPEREAMMTFDQYTEFLKRRGDIIIAIFNKYEAELAKIPAGDGAKALMSEIASRASIQAKREMRGWRPFKPGAEPMDRVIREKVREALKSSPQP